jgi:hypothetical protein
MSDIYEFMEFNVLDYFSSQEEYDAYVQEAVREFNAATAAAEMVNVFTVVSKFALTVGPMAEFHRIALELEDHLDGPFTPEPAPTTYLGRLASLNPFRYTLKQLLSFSIFGNLRGITAGNVSKVYVFVMSNLIIENCSYNTPGLLMFAAFTSLWMRTVHQKTIASRYDAALTLVKPVGVALLGIENVDHMILSVPKWRAARFPPPPSLPPSSVTDAGPDAPAADSPVGDTEFTDDSFVMVPPSSRAPAAAPDSPAKDLAEIERLVAKFMPVLPARRRAIPSRIVSFEPKRLNTSAPMDDSVVVYSRSADA